MAEFTVTTNVTVRCSECRGELFSTTNTDKRSMYNGDVEVQRCECGDESLLSEGAKSRNDEMIALESRIRELEKEVTLLESEMGTMENGSV